MKTLTYSSSENKDGRVHTHHPSPLSLQWPIWTKIYVKKSLERKNYRERKRERGKMSSNSNQTHLTSHTHIQKQTSYTDQLIMAVVPQIPFCNPQKSPSSSLHCLPNETIYVGFLGLSIWSEFHHHQQRKQEKQEPSHPTPIHISF
ncbi:hypothetical protein R6Q59_021117 [Mikania micrantha]